MVFGQGLGARTRNFCYVLRYAAATAPWTPAEILRITPTHLFRNGPLLYIFISPEPKFTHKKGGI